MIIDHQKFNRIKTFAVRLFNKRAAFYIT